MTKSVFAALLCSFVFVMPALAESADHRGPDPDKGRVLLGGVGGAGNQKRADSDKGRDGSEQHGGATPVAGTGGASAAAGPDGQSGHTGESNRLADVAGDIFGGAGDPDAGRGSSDIHGAPGPIAGAGLPFFGIAYGVYWLIKRRRRKPD